MVIFRNMWIILLVFFKQNITNRYYLLRLHDFMVFQILCAFSY